MFCPECGIEEQSAHQFCRSCGTDLRRVRFAVDPPDTVNASAVLAREEIGRAFAAKIREIQDAGDLRRVADRVLPEIEKFLESPEERRLRRMRTGLTLSAIGLGAAIGLTAVAALSHKEEILFLAGLGFITFFLGLGFILNGILFTLPKKGSLDKSSEADVQPKIDRLFESPVELPAKSAGEFTSVTEHTTKHLK